MAVASASGSRKPTRGFSALPTVPDELRGIIRDPTQRTPHGVLPGRIHLDEAFTDTALRAALHERYPVVHIASHFQLHPGDDTASFLLLGRWQPPAAGAAQNLAATLSGGRAADPVGLQYGRGQSRGPRAQKSKAWRSWRSARAPRRWWRPCGPVVDTSTQALMQTFYRLRESQPGLPKVEALRQAQLALLRGAGPPGAATPHGARVASSCARARGVGLGGRCRPSCPSPRRRMRIQPTGRRLC